MRHHTPWGERPRPPHHHPDHPQHADHGAHGGPAAGPPGARPGRGRRGPGGRAPRGDVRSAVLLLLDEGPMHGYQLMQTIADRTGGRWTPSPGAVYPTLAALEDEGLVEVSAEAGRKLATLSETGRAHVAAQRDAWPDPFGGRDGSAGQPDGVDLRGVLEQLHGAVRQIARTGTEAQLSAAVGILGETRRALYLLLADGPDTTAGEPSSDDESSEG